MRLLIVTLLLLLPTFLHAKEEPLYLVEMVFFLHTAEENKQSENWPMGHCYRAKNASGLFSQ